MKVKNKGENPSGFVYFVADGDMKTVKIGFTTNPRSRIRAIRSRGAVRILGVARADLAYESELHNLFLRHRILEPRANRSDWFACDPEILWFIANNPYVNTRYALPPLRDPVRRIDGRIVYDD